MADNNAKKLPAHLNPEMAFKPGQIANPKGRPKGSRNKLGEVFIAAMHDDFIKHGIAAIEVVRAEKPDQYLKVIASLLPKDVNLNVNQMDEMTDDQLIERIRGLNATIQPFLIAEGASSSLNGTGEAQEGLGSEVKPPKVH